MSCTNCAYLSIDQYRHEKGNGKCLRRSYKMHEEPFNCMVEYAKHTCDRFFPKPPPEQAE